MSILSFCVISVFVCFFFGSCVAFLFFFVVFLFLRVYVSFIYELSYD